MYLDYAENFARRKIALTMQDWSNKLNDFLTFNAYPVLEGYGNTRRETAEKRALSEYEKFRVVQDKEFKSDFDNVVDAVRTNKKLPKSWAKAVVNHQLTTALALLKRVNLLKLSNV